MSDISENTENISALLAFPCVIAVVGLSAKSSRASHQVAQYMQAHGYRIVAVNPTYAGAHILGEYCYATLTEAARELETEKVRIDIVDCFRRSEDILSIAEEAIAIGASCLWMQLGIINQKAAEQARAAGLSLVMDRCIKIEHMRLA